MAEFFFQKFAAFESVLLFQIGVGTFGVIKNWPVTL